MKKTKAEWESEVEKLREEIDELNAQIEYDNDRWASSVAHWRDEVRNLAPSIIEFFNALDDLRHSGEFTDVDAPNLWKYGEISGVIDAISRLKYKTKPLIKRYNEAVQKE